ncbi:unnamed protein product [Rotaria sp. Silwood2]|nr:unnamed protein product [Rotaria sp. Silwood2]
MPIEVGLLSSQQDSFEQHEELSKLLNETDVFYVPLRNEYGDNSINTNQDLTDLTKRFDEDLSNKHLIVTFRDIGYSLFLDSVESIPDENDQSKIRVSGKMIVDGICIQFFGCFDHGNRTKKHSNTQSQQINGVGRVELDEKYYRELSSTQITSGSNIKEENKNEKEKHSVEPIIIRRTRQQTAKLKERAETMTLISKPQTRSRTISESTLPKNRTSTSTSPPPPLQITTPLPHSSISTTRPYIHSPSHMPYPLRSPRTKQHRTSSPVHFTPSSTSRNAGSSLKYTSHYYLNLLVMLKFRMNAEMAYTSEDSPECDAVKNLLRDRIDEYVKEVLIPYFSPLITFVRDSDQFLSDGNIKQLENKLTIISKLFSGDFKKTFDLIHNDVMRSFPSLKLSQPILKEVFTQFLSYYHDFQRLLSNNTNLKTASSNISLPNVHQLMVEIKKFKLPFDGDQFKPRS